MARSLYLDPAALSAGNIRRESSAASLVAATDAADINGKLKTVASNAVEAVVGSGCNEKPSAQDN